MSGPWDTSGIPGDMELQIGGEDSQDEVDRCAYLQPDWSQIEGGGWERSKLRFANQSRDWSHARSRDQIEQCR